MQTQEIKYSNKTLDSARKTGDAIADKTVKVLFESGFNPLSNEAYNELIFNHQPIPEEFPENLKEYFKEIKSFQIDEKLAEKGSEFYVEHASAIMLCLGMLSLPYCYAAAEGAKVLSFSKRIYEQPEKRLTETAEFVFDVCSPEAFTPQGKGYISVAKVRLMHAAIRYHLLNSDKWSDELGTPINQEDMAGTNLSFSLIAIRGLRKLGYTISAEQSQNYICYWNMIGEMLGVNKEWLPESNQDAFILEQKIKNRNFHNSEEGEMLAINLQGYIKKQPLPFSFPSETMMAYLLGEDICEMIGLPYDNLKVDLISNIKNLNALRNVFPTNHQKEFRNLKKQFGDRNSQNVPFRFLTSLDV
ncbi:oxygenase MpaB family protein [Marivirga salinae]|uniref:Oxygenase MpaB family protein n=1 Tax=Marivirga salinarum TaxID=3059078 RepID=A0AA51N9R1_9BACT|nr:oxygenase MpaB family protein [Marivirga sp. BDSF4-3]WMN11314.1 oxygenase MpaB family protein [Marivirga sp. BDSF4-3]